MFLAEFNRTLNLLKPLVTLLQREMTRRFYNILNISFFPKKKIHFTILVFIDGFLYDTI